MANSTRVILIWGFAIFVYIAVTQSTGTKQLLDNLGYLTKGTILIGQGPARAYNAFARS